MGMWFMMFGCDLLFPAIMLIAGKLFMKCVPKDIDWIIGFRTAMSMKNPDTWRFAHTVTVVPMIAVLGQPEDVTAAVGLIVMCVLMIPIIAVIPHTESVSFPVS